MKERTVFNSEIPHYTKLNQSRHPSRAINHAILEKNDFFA